MELKIVKHLYRKTRNIEGKVLGEEYSYTVAIKRGWRWSHLRFMGMLIHRPDNRAREILQEQIVKFQTSISENSATHFPTEGDAVAVMNDILNNPDKYIRL